MCIRCAAGQSETRAWLAPVLSCCAPLQVSSQAYFVRRNNKYEQLPEVLEAFQLSPGKRDLLSRCVKCNGRFKSTCAPPTVWRLSASAPQRRQCLAAWPSGSGLFLQCHLPPALHMSSPCCPLPEPLYCRHSCWCAQACVARGHATEHRPPDAVCEEHKIKGFWVCSVCSQAYWHGTQFDRARAALSARLQL